MHETSNPSGNQDKTTDWNKKTDTPMRTIAERNNPSKKTEPRRSTPKRRTKDEQTGHKTSPTPMIALKREPFPLTTTVTSLTGSIQTVIREVPSHENETNNDASDTRSQLGQEQHSKTRAAKKRVGTSAGQHHIGDPKLNSTGERCSRSPHMPPP